MKVELYAPEYSVLWDKFIAQSKNGVFLFFRNYMEYHSDRFTDHSLLFFDDDQLIAVMPANIKGETLVSHEGLTFGGIVTNSAMRTGFMLEIFEALKSYLKTRGLSRIIYKAIPHIYHTLPAEEDLYALIHNDARLVRRDISSTIDMREKLPFSKGRKWSIKQAGKNGLIVKQSYDFKSFMEIEEYVLSSRHNVKPVHLTEEIELLARRFPDNIQLFAAYLREEMLSGVIVYESKNVAHAQYMAASDEGKKVGALDVVLDFLINQRYAGKRYFDFGISTEREGRYLNIGLIDNKEGFGARAIAHDSYKLDLTP